MFMMRIMAVEMPLCRAFLGLAMLAAATAVDPWPVWNTEDCTSPSVGDIVMGLAAEKGESKVSLKLGTTLESGYFPGLPHLLELRSLQLSAHLLHVSAGTLLRPSSGGFEHCAAKSVVWNDREHHRYVTWMPPASREEVVITLASAAAPSLPVGISNTSVGPIVHGRFLTEVLADDKAMSASNQQIGRAHV
eukprot:TRINITY_DN55489_c0_g1_i1.p1 TRINITY_DN55489_c0_g1~~TRINITY_DN55489_c0_g1_i1.p1  ORF type:complete len:206 (+),score=40.78 TRINITY_DN55489_c0_g1_i1:46-618(+)